MGDEIGSKVEEGSFVTPGGFIGTSEEFLTGTGTYEEKGKVYASTTGILNINTKERIVSVKPTVKTPPIPKVGDIVVGRVLDIKGSMVFVDVGRIKGSEDREIAASEQGVIHVSNVKEAYVSELSDEFGYMDIIKAKVIDAKAMRLSTSAKDLGVIKAICSRCKVGMKRKNDRLECPNCGRIEMRKISEDYGMGII